MSRFGCGPSGSGLALQALSRYPVRLAALPLPHNAKAGEMMTLGVAAQLSFSDQRDRWGDAVDPGLLIVPNALLRHQNRLHLDTLDIVVILNIVDFWDDETGLPHPRLSILAARMGKSKRTIERAIVKLSELGYLQHLPSEQLRGKTIRRFDLTGLIQKLQELSRQTPQRGLRSGTGHMAVQGGRRTRPDRL